MFAPLVTLFGSSVDACGPAAGDDCFAGSFGDSTFSILGCGFSTEGVVEVGGSEVVGEVEAGEVEAIGVEVISGDGVGCVEVVGVEVDGGVAVGCVALTGACVETFAPVVTAFELGVAPPVPASAATAPRPDPPTALCGSVSPA